MEAEEIEEVEDGEEVEDSWAPKSRLARKVASFGMGLDGHCTLRRTNGEKFRALGSSALFHLAVFSTGEKCPLHLDFTVLSPAVHILNLNSTFVFDS